MTAAVRRFGRRGLRLVEPHPERLLEWSWFCGHCAAAPPASETQPPSTRVCSGCGLGLVLRTPAQCAPGERDAFLVVDALLSVQAVSRQAENLLRIREDVAINRPMTELLVPAEVDGHRPGSVAATLARAAGGDDRRHSVYLRPVNTFGVRLRARVSTCGPPRAALVVLEDSSRSALRLVPGG